MKRVNTKLISRRTLEPLIASGAFDTLQYGHRAQFFASIDIALEFAKRMQGEGISGAESLLENLVQQKQLNPK